ncbi:MAG: universal stress protein, partial [Halobacteria archaeon]|nr:universal stress protein [Halobacteria archaeon]
VESYRETLEELDTEADVTVDGYISQDVAFTILHLARERDVDLIIMGYPEEHRGIVERVQRRTPCDVVYSSGVEVEPPADFSVVNVGAGGGPYHRALLPLVNSFGRKGSEVHVINVEPEFGGTSETVQETLEGLKSSDTVEVHNVEEKNVAKGLVDTTKENGGVLFIGASRDFLLKQWLFGSTPDRVIDLAEEAGIPVLIYRTKASVSGVAGNIAFLVYRFFHILNR